MPMLTQAPPPVAASAPPVGEAVQTTAGAAPNAGAQSREGSTTDDKQNAWTRLFQSLLNNNQTQQPTTEVKGPDGKHKSEVASPSQSDDPASAAFGLPFSSPLPGLMPVAVAQSLPAAGGAPPESSDLAELNLSTAPASEPKTPAAAPPDASGNPEFESIVSALVGESSEVATASLAPMSPNKSPSPAPTAQLAGVPLGPPQRSPSGSPSAPQSPAGEHSGVLPEKAKGAVAPGGAGGNSPQSDSRTASDTIGTTTLATAAQSATPGGAATGQPTQSQLVQTSPQAERIDVIRQIAQQVSANTPISGSSTSLTVQIQPEHWGKVDVAVNMVPTQTGLDAKTSITATILSADPTVRSVLKAHLDDLSNALSGAGFKVDKVEVASQTVASASAGQGSSAFHQGQGGSGHNPFGLSAQAGGDGGQQSPWSAAFGQQQEGQSQTSGLASLEVSADAATTPAQTGNSIAHRGLIDYRA